MPSLAFMKIRPDTCCISLAMLYLKGVFISSKKEHTCASVLDLSIIRFLPESLLVLTHTRVLSILYLDPKEFLRQPFQGWRFASRELSERNVP